MKGRIMKTTHKSFLFFPLAIAALGCAGSPIGGKYGLGKNAAGYAEEARVRQMERDRLAFNRAELSRYCTPERTPAQMQWCIMRSQELAHEEDRVERQGDRDAQAEREFQNWRQERLTPTPSVNCTGTTDGLGNTTTHCQ